MTNTNSTINSTINNTNNNTMTNTINTINTINNTINHPTHSPCWAEERSFHVTRCAGRWVPCEDPSLFLLLGRKSCLLLHSNAAWM